jgi:hypothetical protein
MKTKSVFITYLILSILLLFFIGYQLYNNYKTSNILLIIGYILAVIVNIMTIISLITMKKQLAIISVIIGAIFNGIFCVMLLMQDDSDNTNNKFDNNKIYYIISLILTVALCLLGVFTFPEGLGSDDFDSGDSVDNMSNENVDMIGGFIKSLLKDSTDIDFSYDSH